MNTRGDLGFFEDTNPQTADAPMNATPPPERLSAAGAQNTSKQLHQENDDDKEASFTNDGDEDLKDVDEPFYPPNVPLPPLPEGPSDPHRDLVRMRASLGSNSGWQQQPSSHRSSTRSSGGRQSGPSAAFPSAPWSGTPQAANNSGIFATPTSEHQQSSLAQVKSEKNNLWNVDSAADSLPPPPRYSAVVSSTPVNISTSFKSDHQLNSSSAVKPEPHIHDDQRSEMSDVPSHPSRPHGNGVPQQAEVQHLLKPLFDFAAETEEAMNAARKQYQEAAAAHDALLKQIQGLVAAKVAAESSLKVAEVQKNKTEAQVKHHVACANQAFEKEKTLSDPTQAGIVDARDFSSAAVALLVSGMVRPTKHLGVPLTVGNDKVQDEDDVNAEDPTLADTAGRSTVPLQPLLLLSTKELSQIETKSFLAMPAFSSTEITRSWMPVIGAIYSAHALLSSSDAHQKPHIRHLRDTAIAAVTSLCPGVQWTKNRFVPLPFAQLQTSPGENLNATPLGQMMTHSASGVECSDKKKSSSAKEVEDESSQSSETIACLWDHAVRKDTDSIGGCPSLACPYRHSDGGASNAAANCVALLVEIAKRSKSSYTDAFVRTTAERLNQMLIKKNPKKVRTFLCWVATQALFQGFLQVPVDAATEKGSGSCWDQLHDRQLLRDTVVEALEAALPDQLLRRKKEKGESHSILEDENFRIRRVVFNAFRLAPLFAGDEVDLFSTVDHGQLTKTLLIPMLQEIEAIVVNSSQSSADEVLQVCMNCIKHALEICNTEFHRIQEEEEFGTLQRCTNFLTLPFQIALSAVLGRALCRSTDEHVLQVEWVTSAAWRLTPSAFSRRFAGLVPPVFIVERIVNAALAMKIPQGQSPASSPNGRNSSTHQTRTEFMTPGRFAEIVRQGLSLLDRFVTTISCENFCRSPQMDLSGQHPKILSVVENFQRVIAVMLAFGTAALAHRGSDDEKERHGNALGFLWPLLGGVNANQAHFRQTAEIKFSLGVASVGIPPCAQFNLELLCVALAIGDGVPEYIPIAGVSESVWTVHPPRRVAKQSTEGDKKLAIAAHRILDHTEYWMNASLEAIQAAAGRAPGKLFSGSLERNIQQMMGTLVAARISVQLRTHPSGIPAGLRRAKEWLMGGKLDNTEARPPSSVEGRSEAYLYLTEMVSLVDADPSRLTRVVKSLVFSPEQKKPHSKKEELAPKPWLVAYHPVSCLRLVSLLRNAGCLVEAVEVTRCALIAFALTHEVLDTQDKANYTMVQSISDVDNVIKHVATGRAQMKYKLNLEECIALAILSGISLAANGQDVQSHQLLKENLKRFGSQTTSSCPLGFCLLLETLPIAALTSYSVGTVASMVRQRISQSAAFYQRWTKSVDALNIGAHFLSPAHEEALALFFHAAHCLSPDMAKGQSVTELRSIVFKVAAECNVVHPLMWAALPSGNLEFKEGACRLIVP